MNNDTARERTCPVCGETYTAHPALSRVDNKTLICPDCGLREAMRSAGFSGEQQEKVIRLIHRNPDV